MKKNRLIWIVCILFTLCLIPVPMHYKDGGSINYRAVLYEITKYHQMTDIEGIFRTGISVEILGIEVYHDTELTRFA